MSTITQTMLEDRVGAAELIRLTDDAGTGSVDTSVMQQIIDDGEAEILVNIGQRYELPLSLTDAVTQRAVLTRLLDVVVYRLFMHRDRVIDESVRDAYRDAIKWSEAVAAGKLGLIGEEDQEESPAGGQFMITGRSQVINRDTMKGL